MFFRKLLAKFKNKEEHQYLKQDEKIQKSVQVFNNKYKSEIKNINNKI